MNRSLTLRRDSLTDLTTDDLTAVAGAQEDSIPCVSRPVVCEMVHVITQVGRTVLNCPMSQGC